MTTTENLLNVIKILIEKIIASGTTSSGSSFDAVYLPQILNELENVTNAVLDTLYWDEAFAISIQYTYTLFNGETVVQTKTVNYPLSLTRVYTYSYAVENGQTVVTQIVRS